MYCVQHLNNNIQKKKMGYNKKTFYSSHDQLLMGKKGKIKGLHG